MFLIEFECDDNASIIDFVEYKWLHKIVFDTFERAEHCAIQCIKGRISPFWADDEHTYDNYSYTIYSIKDNLLTRVKTGDVHCMGCKHADHNNRHTLLAGRA